VSRPIRISDPTPEPVAVFEGGGSGVDGATLQVTNPNWHSLGVAARFTNKGGWHTAFFENKGPGGVLFLVNQSDGSGQGGGDFISGKASTQQLLFAVKGNGEVRSNVGFNTPAGDFAEMLPAANGLTPGDVLVIGLDGKLTRSTQPNQANVAGVYSTQPGFVGGQPVEGSAAGAIPLAIVGVAPVRVTAETGPIRPGDLLVASAIPGHAMRAGNDPAPGTVIGKALEGLDHATGTINMLVKLQ
jgi:hypothetical protein